MKTILVPIDFSECANNALHFAAFIAKKSGASLNVLHITDAAPRKEALGIDPDVRQMMGALMGIKKSMSRTLAQSFLKGIKVKDMIEVGNVYEHTIAAAKKCNADLIVMGTHGAKGAKEAFIGSNAEKVVRNSTIPVLTIKNKVANPKIEKIVCATDFTDETEKIFPTVNELSELFGAQLELVKIITEDTFETGYQSKKTIDQFARKFPDSNFTASVYNGLTKHSGIRHYAHTANASLIALGTHGRHGLARFFEGSVAEKLVNHASLPVLTLNIPKNSVKVKRVKARDIVEKDNLQLTTFNRLSI